MFWLVNAVEIVMAKILNLVLKRFMVFPRIFKSYKPLVPALYCFLLVWIKLYSKFDIS